MLNIVCTRFHSYTCTNWLTFYRRKLKYHLNLIAYEELPTRMPEGDYLFTDIERIVDTPLYRNGLSDYIEELRKRGSRIYNDPYKVLLRYDMQKKLDQAFKVYRSNEDLSALRFPVFLRYENEHSNLSGFIDNHEQLDQALTDAGDCLICEYLDVSDENGIFHKYSSFLINDTVIPRHLFFHKEWMVKYAKIVDEDTSARELAFVQSNQHEDEVRAVFAAANIDYGRIDYSIYKGKVVTWEINTNPTLTTRSTKRRVRKLRGKAFETSSARMNKAFIELSEKHQSAEQMPLRQKIMRSLATDPWRW